MQDDMNWFYTLTLFFLYLQGFTLTLSNLDLSSTELGVKSYKYLLDSKLLSDGSQSRPR